jgi:hypothetical protein
LKSSFFWSNNLFGFIVFSFTFGHTCPYPHYLLLWGIDVLVAIPGVSAHAPDMAFDVEHFRYNKENDTYSCPANGILTTNGKWYNKTNGKSIT